MKGKGGGKADPGEQVIATNRRARFDYDIEDRWEAGLVLTGSEVKSLRASNVNLSDAYAAPRGDELFLLNCRIGEYQQAAHFGHAPLRDRKLLMRRAELDRIRGKVELGLARGRAHEDRRGAIAERESKREMDRALGRARKR